MVTGGRFLYLAIAGGVDVPPLLGSRATYLPTGLGGHLGRRQICNHLAADLLHRTPDPRISTVLAVAKTLGVKIGDLVK